MACVCFTLLGKAVRLGNLFLPTGTLPLYKVREGVGRNLFLPLDSIASQF